MRATVRTLAAAAALSVLATALVATPTPAGAAGVDLEATWADGGALALPWTLGPLRDTADIASTPLGSTTQGGQLLLAGGDDNAHGCITRMTPSGQLDPGFSITPGLIGSVCDFGTQDPGRFVAIQSVGTGLVAAAELPDARRVVRLNEWGGIPGNQDLTPSYTAVGGHILDVTALSDGPTALLAVDAVRPTVPAG